MNFDTDFPDEERFVLKFDTWEGPIEALLDLAKNQKVDLAQINILELVDQFEAVVSKAMSLRLELAADWLLMAAWLTYLKSRLLLKRTKDRKSGPVEEDVLARHLKRLNMVRLACEQHADRLTLGRDWFPAHLQDREIIQGSRLGLSFHEFLAAYPRGRAAELLAETPELKPFDLASVDSAIARLKANLPDEWINLLDLVPKANGLKLSSGIATTLIGALELTRDHWSELDQPEEFGTIRVKRRSADE